MGVKVRYGRFDTDRVALTCFTWEMPSEITQEIAREIAITSMKGCEGEGEGEYEDGGEGLAATPTNDLPNRPSRLPQR